MRTLQKKLKPTVKPSREGYRVVIPQKAAKGKEVFREQNRACLRSSNNGMHTLIRCLLVAPLEVLPPTRQVLLFLHGFTLRGMVVVMMGRGFGASRACGSGRGTARCHAGLPHALKLMANAMRLVVVLCRHARGASRSAVVRGDVWTRESGGGGGRYATGGREERLSAAAVDATTAGRSARKGAERWWTDAGRVVRANGAR